MNEKIDTTSEAKFATKVAEALDEASEALDDATQQRLSDIRNQALREIKPKPSALSGYTMPWLFGGACAATVLAAVLIFNPSATEPLEAAALSELELLASNEDIDMFEQDLEFYDWLEDQENI